MSANTSAFAARAGLPAPFAIHAVLPPTSASPRHPFAQPSSSLGAAFQMPQTPNSPFSGWYPEQATPNSEAPAQLAVPPVAQAEVVSQATASQPERNRKREREAADLAKAQKRARRSESWNKLLAGDKPVEDHSVAVLKEAASFRKVAGSATMKKTQLVDVLKELLSGRNNQLSDAPGRSPGKKASGIRGPKSKKRLKGTSRAQAEITSKLFPVLQSICTLHEPVDAFKERGISITTAACFHCITPPKQRVGGRMPKVPRPEGPTERSHVLFPTSLSSEDFAAIIKGAEEPGEDTLLWTSGEDSERILTVLHDALKEHGAQRIGKRGADKQDQSDEKKKKKDSWVDHRERIESKMRGVMKRLHALGERKPSSTEGPSVGAVATVCIEGLLGAAGSKVAVKLVLKAGAPDLAQLAGLVTAEETSPTVTVMKTVSDIDAAARAAILEEVVRFAPVLKSLVNEAFTKSAHREEAAGAERQREETAQATSGAAAGGWQQGAQASERFAGYSKHMQRALLYGQQRMYQRQTIRGPLQGMWAV